MKKIKKFLKKIDLFAIPFVFKYKNKYKYYSSLGGLMSLLFVIAALIIGIYYFIPFYNRKNYNIIYYSMNMPKTDTIKLNSKANFAIGLECPLDKKTHLKGKDLFDLKLTYIISKTDHNGNRSKDKIELTTHSCNETDFYNNDTINFMNFDEVVCLDKTDNSLQGIYTDEIFSYYEFSLLAKNDSVELFRKIDTYLTETDCKLELFYTEVTIDFDNYTDPIKTYINSVFIQLNPTLFLKMNVYFENQYFENDNFLFFIFDEKKEEKTIDPYIHFSRIEDYSLYKGLDRGIIKPSDYTKYANIYVRADTTKTVTKRKYQKVTEFYADASSLLIALFQILYFSFLFINRFYANHSLAKKIFFFKEMENKNFNINRKAEQIKNLINLTKSYIDQPKPFNYSDNNNNKNNNQIPSNKIDENEKGINIYIKKANCIIKESDEERTKDLLKYNDIKKLKKKKKKRKILNKNNISSKIYDLEDNNKKQESILQNSKRIIFNKYQIGPINKFQNVLKKSNENDLATIEIFKFTYNIFEILFSFLSICCKRNKLKIKNNITEKANNFLNHRLDISLYVKNTILIDIMSKTLINENMKEMIKFISVPKLSINKSLEIDADDFYKNYTVEDFNKLYDEISNITRNAEMSKEEKNIFSLFYNELKEVE